MSRCEVAESRSLRPTDIWNDVRAEIRWSFTPPFDWLAGVVANLILACAYLALVPLTDHRRHWVVLLGTYFGTFILADVTTTNLLGPDAERVRDSLGRGTSIRRILLIKNLSLVVIVVIPTLIFTTILSLTTERSIDLLIALPLVTYPMLVWIAIGNIVSVLLPVRVVRLRSRWRDRYDLRRTVWWLVHLAVPYLLLYPVTPLVDLPRFLVDLMPRAHQSLVVDETALWLASPTIVLLGVAVATQIVRRRGLHIR